MQVKISMHFRAMLIAGTITLMAIVNNVSDNVWAQDAPEVPKNNSEQSQQAGADDELGADSNTALMRGPVHEAFAEQFADDPTPTEVIDKEPPEAIDEVPPDFKPDGENIEWISGYWGWDVESEGFVWVTGVWRNVPPDQQWVPGYWSKVDNGWQWISGFWTAAESDELVYLPTPPEAVENGPSSEAPGEDYFWISGSWQYDQNQYAWQAGYWAQGHDDWTWVPNRYVWTPGGCIYREGYWDHELEDRGTIFCPMNFQAGYQQQFQPRYVVEVGPLWLANLFVTPGFNHYCFGNYNGYKGNQTVVPWVNYYQRTNHQDPMYAYYAYQSRNSNLIRQIARVERQISSNPALRAQTTVAAQLLAFKNLSGPQASWALRAIQLKTLAANNDGDFDTPFQFAAFQRTRNQAENQANRSSNQLAAQRRKFEQAENNEDKQRAQRSANNQNENNNDAKVTSEPRGDVKRMKIREQNKATEKGLVNSENSVGALDKSKSLDKKQSDREGETGKKDPSIRKDPKVDGKTANDNRKDEPKSTGKDDRKPNSQSPNNNGNNASKNKKDEADKPKANDAKRAANSLDRLHQGLDDKPSGADDARELREMRRRSAGATARANAGANQTKGAKNPETKAPTTGKRQEPAAGGAKSPAVKPPEQARPNPNTRDPAAPSGKNPNPKGPGANKPAKPNRGKD